MIKSEQINELAAALAKAQAEMHNPGFDSQNPHFRSKFASLAAVRNAVIPVLAKHGLSLMQQLTSNDAGTICTTLLLHASGQFIEFEPLLMPVSKQDAQGFGSASTYAKRYSMQAIAAVVGDEDDDGNAASERSDRDDSGRPDGWRSQDTRKVTEYRNRILSCINEGKDLHAVEVWKEVKDEHEFATALWATLPQPIKNMIKKGMEA